MSRSWISEKLFIMQNYTDNANGDVPLTAKNVIVLVSQGEHIHFCEEQQIWSVFFFIKSFFIL